MPVTKIPLPPSFEQGFSVLIYDDRELVIEIQKGHESLIRHSNWVQVIIEHCVADFPSVVIDAHKVASLSSTVIAGFVILHDQYSAKTTKGIVVANACERIKKVLKMMQLHTLFNFVDEWEPNVDELQLDELDTDTKT
jgi:anti-anti-sigma regulatory factor